MRIIDVTHTLDGSLETYPGDPKFEQCELSDLSRDGYRLSRISLCTHTGTHIDAPSHYIGDGEDVCDIDPEKLVGRCLVSGSREDTRAGLLRGIRRFILLFCPDRELLTDIIASGALLIGTAMLTIGDDAIHAAALKNGVALVEYLKLDGVAPGEYTVVALPLKLRADGAPARVILIKDNEDMRGDL